MKIEEKIEEKVMDVLYGMLYAIKGESDKILLLRTTQEGDAYVKIFSLSEIKEKANYFVEMLWLMKGGFEHCSEEYGCCYNFSFGNSTDSDSGQFIYIDSTDDKTIRILVGGSKLGVLATLNESLEVSYQLCKYYLSAVSPYLCIQKRERFISLDEISVEELNNHKF